MESSPPLPGADAEECSSSESGWTMYLASPMHGGTTSYGFDDDDDGGGGDSDDEGEVDGPSCGSKSRGDQLTAAAAAGVEEEDDSMTSDASSGTPGHGTCYVKEMGGHCCSKCCGNEKLKEEKAVEKGALSSRPASICSNSK